MIQQDGRPWRFGIHASVIQLLALFLAGLSLDGGITEGACTLASLQFWTCSASLLWWHDGRASRTDLFFLRWGLLAFVLVGTPLLRPAFRWQATAAGGVMPPNWYIVSKVKGAHPGTGTE